MWNGGKGKQEIAVGERKGPGELIASHSTVENLYVPSFWPKSELRGEWEKDTWYQKSKSQEQQLIWNSMFHSPLDHSKATH